MSFHEKSAWIMLATVTAVYGWYFLNLASALPPDGAQAAGIPYRGDILFTVIVLVMLAIASHITLAVLAPKEADTFDERDRQIDHAGEYIGGHLAGATAVLGLGLAIFEQPHFWIANALLAGLVIAQIVTCGIKVVLYRRGF